MQKTDFNFVKNLMKIFCRLKLCKSGKICSAQAQTFEPPNHQEMMSAAPLLKFMKKK